VSICSVGVKCALTRSACCKGMCKWEGTGSECIDRRDRTDSGVVGRCQALVAMGYRPGTAMVVQTVCVDCRSCLWKSVWWQWWRWLQSYWHAATTKTEAKPLFCIRWYERVEGTMPSDQKSGKFQCDERQGGQLTNVIRLNQRNQQRSDHQTMHHNS
jgi:hypothetical protein